MAKQQAAENTLYKKINNAPASVQQRGLWKDGTAFFSMDPPQKQNAARQANAARQTNAAAARQANAARQTNAAVAQQAAAPPITVTVGGKTYNVTVTEEVKNNSS